jgi:hypothetical protein
MLREAFHLVQSRAPKIDGIFDRMRAPGELRARLYRAWDEIGAIENASLLQVFFQRFGVAVYEREDNRVFLDEILGNQTLWLADILTAEGYPAHWARHAATAIVSMWRGLQLALVAGEDPGELTNGYRLAIDLLISPLNADARARTDRS